MTVTTDPVPKNVQGSPEDDVLYGSIGPDTINGNAGDDILFGGAGSDLLYGDAGRDRLYGGFGDDRVIGESSDPQFDHASAQIFRLYQATLNRSPDYAGHIGWTIALTTQERPLSWAVSHFVASSEFQNLYGATIDEQFVTLLYHNVLDREPDTGGLSGWVNALSTGAWSREEVVLAFSESPEFRNQTDAATLAYSHSGHVAAWTGDVYRLYRATLGRDPDLEGLCGWAEALADGHRYLEIVTGFVESREFDARYGATTDGEFVSLLYNNVLDREPDAEGLASWTRALQSGGKTREQVVEGFAQSNEFVTLTADDLIEFMRGSGQDDRLDGGAGNNILFGGIGSDTFVFERTSGGSHRVAGLEAWDWVELRGFGYLNAAEAMSHVTAIGSDTIFSDLGVAVIFEDTGLDQVAGSILVH